MRVLFDCVVLVDNYTKTTERLLHLMFVSSQKLDILVSQLNYENFNDQVVKHVQTFAEKYSIELGIKIY